VAMLLVRSGLRCFVLADGDRVEASNLNRQFFWPEDVGRLKVEALGDRLRALEPELDMRLLARMITAAEAPELFRGCDVVVEALDAPELKAGLCRSLLGAGLYVVAASGLGGTGGNLAPPMRTRTLGDSLVCVGDFMSAVSGSAPPLAPRVMQAAALQADAVLARLLKSEGPPGHCARAVVLTAPKA
ncbi:ThiF family adenylyltransferase, partial [Desulfovibrio sp. OttesenSCG-928-A18]|nr:ThiF family adenylyltransferase [Desulfovibrio sp. OttesenSCG-928-A18]